MAFTIYVTVGDTTTQLNDGNPFRLQDAHALSGAEIIRHQQSGPFQSGVTDDGYRLRPRLITLNILFYAATDALLDSYRDTLMEAFRPQASTSIALYCQRDDGETRVLTCAPVGEVAIALVPEQRPGHLHRATVELRAANPLWSATSVTSNETIIQSWWLAGGYIGTAQVKEHVENPAQRQDWDWADLNTMAGDWAIAVNTARHTSAGTAYVWDSSTAGEFFYHSGSAGYFFNGGTAMTWPGGTAANYHVIELRSNTSYWRYWDGSAIATHGSVAGDINLVWDGMWRARDDGVMLSWEHELTRAVIFTSPTDVQVLALAPYVMGSAPYGITATNEGDVPAYPYITLRGPLVDPVLTNVSAGGSINLTGLTLGTTDICIIDLRTGTKTLTTASGTNLLGSITYSPASMADFYLAPAPVAEDGVNVIAITAGSVGTAAYAFISFTNQYMSY